MRAELVQIERAHKAAIRRGDDAAVRAFGRVHFMYVGILAEVRLRKIIADPTGFNPSEREIAWAERRQAERWLEVLKLAFTRHHGVPSSAALDATTLTSGALAQYETVRALLEGDLRPVIEARNKQAHGQWAHRLASQSESRFLQQPTPAPLNYVAIHSRAQILDAIARLVSVLAVSEPTFQRDYDNTIHAIDTARQALAGATYSKYVNELQRRRR